MVKIWRGRTNQTRRKRLNGNTYDPCKTLLLEMILKPTPEGASFLLEILNEKRIGDILVSATSAAPFGSFSAE